MTPRRNVGLLGCGAVGSWFAMACATLDLALTLVDRDLVGPENLGVSAFGLEDLGRRKADALASILRGSRRVVRCIDGDVRYVVRPGLAAALDAVVLCLDNPAALYDAAAAVWVGAGAGVPVLALTCGGPERPGWLVRVFITPGRCPACAFGRVERDAAARALHGAVCAQATAPRASAGSAAAAGAAGARLLGQWLAGDRSVAGCRIQDDGGGDYRAAMPAEVSPYCTAAHEDALPLVDLGGSVSTVSVGELAERALEHAGHDAAILLGRRSVPLGGLYCPSCHAHWGSPPILMPAAIARPRPCACPATPRPLGERHEIGARELLALDGGTPSLAAIGAAPGDEFVATGEAGRVRLRCTFDWRELDAVEDQR